MKYRLAIRRRCGACRDGVFARRVRRPRISVDQLSSRPAPSFICATAPATSQVRRAAGQTALVNGSRRWRRGRSSDIQFRRHAVGNDYYVCAMWRNSGKCGASGYRGRNTGGFLSDVQPLPSDHRCLPPISSPSIPANVVVDARTSQRLRADRRHDAPASRRGRRTATCRPSTSPGRSALRRPTATFELTRRRALGDRLDQSHDEERRDPAPSFRRASKATSTCRSSTAA